MIGALPTVDVETPRPDQPTLYAVKALKLSRPSVAAEDTLTAHVVGSATVQACIPVRLSARVKATVVPKPPRVHHLAR
jgi:hypothetical protein